jgi:hypothetical protein
MTKVRISDDGLADLSDGHWFYEAQEPGLGDYFTSFLRADIEALKVSAGIHPIVYQDYHRLLSRVFPCGVFYSPGRPGRSRLGSRRSEARSGVDS